MNSELIEMISLGSDARAKSPKRKSSSGGININAAGRAVKRRASKACQCCRARKVRCNVVEHGAPCTNCRLDEVPCIVTESKRRKKTSFAPKSLDAINENPHRHVHCISGAEALANGNVNPTDISNPAFRRQSESGSSLDDEDDAHLPHVPHPLYQSQSHSLGDHDMRTDSFHNPGFVGMDTLMNSASMSSDLMNVSNRLQSPPLHPSRANQGDLPPYVKSLPQRMSSDDIHYLWKKGALSIPEIPFRNELMRCYVEYVHPYMPVIELHDFLHILDRGDGVDGQISLVLLQGIMFTGIAFVDMHYLEAAGFSTRKAARKAFYQKARLLYDFDYETDRLALIQSLLLMTYWYETPDDQKDTWHWMGVAISLAHTIGLHRNCEKSNMDIVKQRLWKRIWWACYIRDRLVALGMRRPTRIKDRDFDVPMLQLSDFEIQPISTENTIISPSCVLMRDTSMQTDLALMCISKAKLCLCMSHVLSAQYSVLVRDQGSVQSRDGNTRSSVMLFPKKLDQADEVRQCDDELTEWVSTLPEACAYTPPNADDVARGRSPVVVQRALLHMVYMATSSALHRPQVLPSADASTLEKNRDLQVLSRIKVRDASRGVTRISNELHKLHLVRYLPTAGVTVLLPAIIIHLLDMKAANDSMRQEALQGFCSCMQVLEKLRDNYAAADYASQFLEAAIKNADIGVAVNAATEKIGIYGPGESPGMKSQPPRKVVQNVSQLIDVGRAARLTPPPDHGTLSATKLFPPNTFESTDNGLASATTPPDSDDASHHESLQIPSYDPSKLMLDGSDTFEEDSFNELIDFGGLEGPEDWGTTLEEGVHGESGGFAMDMDWMKIGEQAPWTNNAGLKLEHDEEMDFMM